MKRENDFHPRFSLSLSRMPIRDTDTACRIFSSGYGSVSSVCENLEGEQLAEALSTWKVSGRCRGGNAKARRAISA